jgi:hypothetical protein
LAPIDLTVLAGHLSISYTCVFFSTYTNSILGASNFVTGIDPVGCSGKNCTAVFLPGGLQIARLLDIVNGPGIDLNATLLSKSPAVVVHNAPGYHLEFSPVDPDFTFDDSTECEIFGEERGQGLRLCIGSYNSAIVAGTI